MARLPLDLPDELKKRIAHYALVDRRSMNMQIVKICEEYVEKRDAALRTQGDWDNKKI